MSIVAAVVITLALALTLALLWCMGHCEGKEPALARRRENLHRLNLARKVGSDFYTFEDDDGSLSWRRVSAN